MSHHLISKKVWISVVVLAVMFFALTYAWFYFTNQFLLQAEIEEREELRSEEESEAAKEMAKEPAKETAQPMTEPIQEKEPVNQFPCTLQLRDGAIGLYDEEGNLRQSLRQVGEYLSEQDRMQLIRGIRAENEQELIGLCESYHLQ